MTTPASGLRAAVAVLILSACLLGAGAASAAPQASIVMDMRNGEVLYARSADRRLHPASLTKMMTLYLTFKAVEDGKLRLDQKLRVSRHAARQPRSKLYLKRGQRVTVRSLIRATALKSANDAAMVLAEGIGGSQKGFARMMTRMAKRLGMKNTAFKNPHGLTSRGHYSTARDMAVLGRHLFFDFPQYYNIFKRRTDYAAGKRIWSTNRLLSTYPGADGIKTGYTRAAGYNLVASAHRGKKRVIAVQFGAPSSGQRAKKVARLLDIGFSRAKANVRRRAPGYTEVAVATRSRTGRVRVDDAPIPVARPGMQESVMAALAQVLVTPVEAAEVPVADLSPAPRPTVRTLPDGARRIGSGRISVQVDPAWARVPVPLPRPVWLAAR